VPFQLNRLAAEVSSALSVEYAARYGLDIPEWRVLATLGFRHDACSAQYIAHCTRTHKSTISRAVTSLMKRQIIERVENEDDRREFRLRLTRKGAALYEELIPRLLRKEQEILSCLSRRSGAISRGSGQDRAEPRSGADQRRGRREERTDRALSTSLPATNAKRLRTERSDEAIHLSVMPHGGLLRCARNDGGAAGLLRGRHHDLNDMRRFEPQRRGRRAWAGSWYQPIVPGRDSSRPSA
jgi:DNA-binding MarR family transcriptional regulator